MFSIYYAVIFGFESIPRSKGLDRGKFDFFQCIRFDDCVTSTHAIPVPRAVYILLPSVTIASSATIFGVIVALIRTPESSRVEEHSLAHELLSGDTLIAPLIILPRIHRPALMPNSPESP
jgi:hypothetical protein